MPPRSLKSLIASVAFPAFILGHDPTHRIICVSYSFGAGQVYFPERASWLADLEAGLFALPGSRHDDQCDSVSQAPNDERSNSLAVFMKAYG